MVTQMFIDIAALAVRIVSSNDIFFSNANFFIVKEFLHH
jgi:hypothetical protein